MNKKLLIIISTTAIFCYACTPTTPTTNTQKANTEVLVSVSPTNKPQQTTVPTTAFDTSFISNPPTSLFKKSKQDSNWIYYDGTATLSGKFFEEGPDNIGGEIPCFIPDTKSAKLIPTHPEIIDPWFCFNNQNTNNILKINDKKLLDNTSNCGLDSQATVVISHYQETTIAGETWDLANLDKLISTTPIKKTCAK